MAERDWEWGRDDWDRTRRYRGEGSARSDYDYPGDRERRYGRRGDERGFLEKLRDELSSWFSAEEAERGRGRDDRQTGRWGGRSEDAERDWASQWGYVEGRGWRNPDRGPEASSGYGYRASSSYGSQRYAGDPWYAAPTDYGRAASSHRPPHFGQTMDYRHSGSAWPGSATGGSFAGRGPRGYQRSDDRIREEICERMCDSAELDASDIEIVVLSGEVTLQGTVNDRYGKRLAEDLTERVSGVREVNNQLRVTASQQAPPNPQNRPGDPPRYRVV